MTRTVRSIKLGNPADNVHAKEPGASLCLSLYACGCFGEPKKRRALAREWEIRWVSNILPFNKKGLSQNQSYSNEISSMVLQLNLEHYEFSSSNLDLKNIVFKKKGTGGLSHVRRERMGCISKGVR